MHFKINTATEEKMVQELSQHLYDNIVKFNESQIGKLQTKDFVIYSINAKNEVIGGIKGDIFGPLCRVFTVWVEQELRKKGLGRALFSELEEFAKKNGCHLIQLDTTEFQAKPFYEKLGLSVIATLPENFMGYTTYILRKKI